MPEDGIKWKCEWIIEKAEPGEDPHEVIEGEGNLAVNSGLNLCTQLICGAGGTSYANANAHIGVGDSSTAAAAGQTDLQAATNKLRKSMEASFPTSGSSQQMVWKSKFTTAEANFAWNEFGVFNASSSGTMLNRKVFSPSPGTKTSAEEWTLTVTVTLA